MMGVVSKKMRIRKGELVPPAGWEPGGVSVKGKGAGL